LIRTGKAIQETADLVQELGGEIIGCGAIVRFEDAPAEVTASTFNRSLSSTAISTTLKKRGQRRKASTFRLKP
jgi:adenine/guanine phosphoribosyltransferase-like PRPP-binding protein